MYAYKGNLKSNTWNKITKIMIDPRFFYHQLITNRIDFFTGVPDSLLKNFCAFITDHTQKEKNIIVANEGNAIALASGYYMATGNIPLIYMQNSGIGNSINPLLSLADIDVYSLPLLLLVGWRGKPGIKDEPQHIKQGKVTTELFETMNIPHRILGKTNQDVEKNLTFAIKTIKERNCPFALIVEKEAFEPYELKTKIQTNFQLNREDAIKTIVDTLSEDDIIVSTTGKTSRELFEYRDELGQSHEKDFLTVGSMGHANHIALGIALQKKDRNVYCFDGDGAVIMHMGALAIIGDLKPKNLIHIILNNGSHDSVGGQPTVGYSIDFCSIAKSCGYKQVLSVETRDGIMNGLNKLKNSDGPSMVEIKINKGARKNLGRPTISTIQNKNNFMGFLKK